MRIAQLANFVGPASGGMRVALDALARGYAVHGVPRLLVVPGPYDARTGTDAGEVVQLRAPRVGSGYRLIVEPWRVVDVLERFAPTSVELSDKLTLLPVTRWARRSGVRSVLFSHEHLGEMLAGRTGLELGPRMSVALLNRLLVRSVDAVVVTSRYAEGELAPVAAGVGCPVVRVPLGVDLETFRPPPSAAPAPGGSGTAGPLRLVHVGRLSREKSPHLAVATAVELHRRGVDVRLDVWGDGPHRDELVALAGDAPVHLGGHVADRRAVSAALGAADVALSVCPTETFGLAVLEALASGTPVVTADTGGAREIVDATSGAWAPALPGPLADAVLEVAARPEGARRRDARLRAERFTWERAVERMLAVHAGEHDTAATA